MSNVNWNSIDLGPVDAYALAVAGGYTGTKQEWIEEIANASINAQTASQKAEAAADSAEDAEAWALGTRDGDPVTSDDPTYENNAEYWAGQSLSHANAAQTAAEQATIWSGTAMLAGVYNTVTPTKYAVGDYVLMSEQTSPSRYGLYVVTVAHTSDSSVPINPTYFRRINVGREISEKYYEFFNTLKTLVGKTAIPFIDTVYISTDVSVGSSVTLIEQTDKNYFTYAIADVTPGDVITINGTSAKYGMVQMTDVYMPIWAFIDAENKLVSKSDTTKIVAENLKVTVPENAAKIILNMEKTLKGICYKGSTLIEDLAALDDDKADKVSGATSGNFAGLDSNGNLTDSGHKHADYLGASLKGAANGVAELDSSGKVPSGQLPSYVDDVLEYASTSAFPATGETGKIYVAMDTNKTYRWGGSAYAEISESLALGETSSTAYRGDRGADAYAHAVTNKGSAVTYGLNKIGTNSEGHVTQGAAVTKQDIVDLGIPGEQTDITGKADKVSGATNGNFAALDSNGNLTDSGVKPGDLLQLDSELEDGTKAAPADVVGQLTLMKTDHIYNETEPSAICSVSDGAALPVKTLTVDVDPVQDLHGYDNPWPGGGGVNKFDPYDATPVPAGRSYNLTVTVDTDTEIISATGNANWSSSGGSFSFALVDVTKNYSGLVGNVFVVSKSSNITSVNSVSYSNGTIVINATVTTNGTTSLSVKVSFASASQTSWSPYSNECPISGWDSANVSRTGKNLIPSSAIIRPSTVQIRAWYDGTGTTLKKGTYTFSCTYGNVSGLYVNRYVNGSNGTMTQKYNSNFITFTLDEDTDGINLYALHNGDLSDYTIQLELGSSATTYKPYSGTTAEYEFPQSAGTVYGGSLTIHQDGTGELVVDRENIASYNGETLPGRWISDRDVYAQGSTPTTGAQVVYELATPVTYQLTNRKVIELLKGSNCLFADCGDVSIEYPADTKLYIDGKVAELQALILENISNS